MYLGPKLGHEFDEAKRICQGRRGYELRPLPDAVRRLPYNASPWRCDGQQGLCRALAQVRGSPALPPFKRTPSPQENGEDPGEDVGSIIPGPLNLLGQWWYNG